MPTSPAVRLVAFSFAFCLWFANAGAQTAAPAASQPAAPADPSTPQLTVRANGKNLSTLPPGTPGVPDAQKYIAREFGPGFHLAKAMPVMLGDLDGDGLEDAVFIASGGSPLISAGAFNYSVIDPYDGYWSFADPKLNANVPRTDPGPHYFVLIAHDWQGEHAKAKFVIMNLPFQHISLTPTTMGKGRFSRSKKIVDALATVERDGQTGAVFWDGKAYKFVQLGNVEDDE